MMRSSPKSEPVSEGQIDHPGKRRRSISDPSEHCKRRKVQEPTKAKNLLASRLSRNLRSAVYSNKSSSQPPGEDLTQVSLHNNIDLVKNSSLLSNTANKNQTKKKSVNDRFKLAKKCVLGPLYSNAKKKDTIILKSPEKSSDSFKENTSHSSLLPTPAKGLCCTESSTGQGIDSKSTSEEVFTPEALLGSSFITVSEASSSASSSKTCTPRERLIKIRKSCSSSDCDKTLTPTTGHGLKLPLNRNLFNNRSEPAVQTQNNDFKSPKDEPPEKDVQVPAGLCDNTVDAQLKPNTVSQTKPDSSSRNIIFDATTSQNVATEVESSFDVPIIRTSKSIFANNNVTHRITHHSEPANSEISASKIFPPGVRSPKKSATDRIKRIKTESCTYKENEQRVLHDTGTKNPAPPEAQLKNNFFKNPMVEIPEFQGFLPSPDREVQTREWVAERNYSSSPAENSRMSDSLVVNVDDSLLNKSELPDPIEDVSMDWDSIPQPSDAEYFSRPAPVPKKDNLICVVTDTNVFVHFLHRVKELVTLKLPGLQQAKIYVPWMVLKELDHLKDRCGEPVRSCALNAEKLINSYVGLPDAKIIGQTVQEASDQQDIGLSPDDKILSCCFQALNKYECVILLSNDINLRNKAIINNIVAYTPHDIISSLKSLKFCKTSRDLLALWSKIIGECCEQAYGMAWPKMESWQNVTLLECMRRFKKYWPGVFRGLLLKQALKPLDALLHFLMKQKGHLVDESDQFKTFNKLVLDFSIYLLDIPAHREQVKKFMKTIPKDGG